MSAAIENSARRAEAIKWLRDHLTSGQEIYTILRHISRSGMLHHISVIVVLDGEARDISWYVSAALGYASTADHALKVPGAGMDMGFHVVYTLSRTLFGADVGRDAGYALKQRWM